MRSNGVAEKFCTGDAAPFEKFLAWAGTVPHTLRNPLYHWTHLELKRYFGIDELLDEKMRPAHLEESQRTPRHPGPHHPGHPEEIQCHRTSAPRMIRWTTSSITASSPRPATPPGCCPRFARTRR